MGKLDFYCAGMQMCHWVLFFLVLLLDSIHLGFPVLNSVVFPGQS
jgi:hypothetical protein